MADKKTNISLNKLLIELGLENYTISDDGTPITRFDQLARLIWNIALGYKEADPKTNTEILHKPDKSFMQMIYDRIEGKVPMAAPIKDDSRKASVADKVSEQVKSRANDLID